MTAPQSALHMADFLSNMKEVDRLGAMHTFAIKHGATDDQIGEILHKSAIVLTVACWEAFVEDLIGRALEVMLEHGSDHTKFPTLVLERVASKHHGLKAWELAGEGWKLALRDNLSEVLAKTTGAFNTPKSDHVDQLFERALGFKTISAKWTWTGRRAASTRAELDALVSLRGAIAHRVKAATSVDQKQVRRARSLVMRLAVKSHNAVLSHLGSTVGARPWETFWYRKTK